jgi:hypothetical protein
MLTKKWKAIILVCVTVPLGFLVAWQAGWIGQPPTDAKNLNSVDWEFVHPTGYRMINQWQNASFSDNVCSLTFAAGIGSYVSDPPETLDFSASAYISGQGRDFHVKSASVAVVNVTGSTTIEFVDVLTNFQNLSFAGMGMNYVDFSGNGHSESAYFSAVAHWYVTTPTNLTCRATVVFEVTYFNGTAYRRIMQPINLILSGDKHILGIDALITGNPPVHGVNALVWVNGTQYTMPVLLLLPPATYVIRVEPSISQNSQNYSFKIWDDGVFDSTRILSLTGDKDMTASFAGQ